MAKSISLHRLINASKIDRYEDREEVLKVAQKEGFNSRQAVYVALAYAYQWYTMSVQDRSYMESKFKSKEITVSEWTPANLFISTIKLVFDFDEPRYYSRVSEYAMVLQYIDRMIDDAKYQDEAENPGIVLKIIKDGGGVKKCAIDQRSHIMGRDTGIAQADIDDYLQLECEKIYKTRKSAASVTLTSSPNAGDFVLMLGRAAQDGSVDVVDTMSVGKEEIYKLTKDHALNDTSTLSDTLNLLGDALGYLDAYSPKEEPIVTVEKNGTAIYMSLAGKEDVSVVVTATPKDQGMLATFKARAHMSFKHRNWFKGNVQQPRLRRLYSIQPLANPKKAIAAFTLNSNIQQGFEKHIHFNPMTPETAGQIMTNTLDANDWEFEVGFGRLELDDLYVWTKGWLELKRPKAEERIIPMIVDDQRIILEGKGGSESKELSANTGFAQGTSRTYRVFGSDFCKVIQQLWLNNDVMGFYLQAPKKGLIEIKAEDIRLDYRIDIPTVMKDNKTYSQLHFDILP